MYNIEAELIKIAWRYSDNVSYQGILYGAKQKDLDFHTYVMYDLQRCGFGGSNAERSRIAEYVCEHFSLNY